MNKKKILFPLSLLSLIAVISTSCSGSGLTHEINSELHIYQADLNHNGKIEDNEKNLTWKESYDVLLSQASDMQELTKAADEFGISKDEVKRTSLARYEILHQAEELLMSTGAIVPLYNYADPYLLKTKVKGLYSTNLGYKFFDKLEGKSNKEYDVCVGTIATSFDPGQNTDASTANLLCQVYEGAKRWERDDNPISGEEKAGIYGAHLTDGAATVEKKLVTLKHKTQDNDIPEGYISIDDCPELLALTESGYKKYENTARYTITLDKKAKWNDGTDVKADDFIYSWNRSSSAVYNGNDFGMWCGLFDCIRGFDVWNKIGQQIAKDPSGWKREAMDEGEERTKLEKKDKEKWDKLKDEQKAEWQESFDTNGAAGGMCGVMKGTNTNGDETITVQLINDCEYFEELLAFPAFFPIKKENIIIRKIKEKDTSEVKEKEHVCIENKKWWINKDNKFACNGPLKIDGEINNVEAGGATLVKNGDDASVTVDKVRFHFIDKDGAMLDSYISDSYDMIDSIPSSVIEYWREQPDWHLADQIGLFYYLFNVNDNTFDRVKGKTTGEHGERNREKFRKIMNLLINRRDICYNVVKSGVTSADGMVTKGITEKCVPEEKTLEDGTKVVVAKREGKNLVTMDWTLRNKDQSLNWNQGEAKEQYKDHWLDKRTNDGSVGGGFYHTYESKVAEMKPPKEEKDLTDEEKKQCEKSAMEDNLAEAYKLAKELEEDGAGVKVEGTATDFHFTQFPKITLSTNNGTGLEDLAERMQSYYDLFGIDMSIETQEWQSFSATRRIGDYAYARHGWVADYNDPRTYLDLCRSTDGNNDSQLGKTEKDDEAHIHVSH